MSPSLHGVPRRSVPPLRWYYETLRFLAALSALLRCLRSAVPPKRPIFAPWGEERFTPGLEVVLRFASFPLLVGGGGKASQVPREPQSVHALLFDPGETSTSGPTPLDASVQPSPNSTGSALAIRTISGLNHTACTPSCVRFATAGRPVTTQHSLPADGLSLPGRDVYLPGSAQGFKLLHGYPPCPGLSWRTGFWYTSGSRSGLQARIRGGNGGGRD